jgi:hypothetical protein
LDRVGLAEPVSEVDQLASLGTKRREALLVVLGEHVLADGATSHGPRFLKVDGILLEGEPDAQ